MHYSMLFIVAFSPSGQTLASALEKTVKLWDTTTAALKKTLDCHSCGINSVAFSFNGVFLASGSTDHTIRISKTETGEMLHKIEGYSGQIYFVTFSLYGPSEQLLASVSADQTVKLWNITTGALCQTLEGHSFNICSAIFSPDSQILDSVSYKTIKLWGMPTGVLMRTLQGHSDWIDFTAFSPDGQLIASASTDQTIKLWDTETGAILQSLDVSATVDSLQFSSNSSYLETNVGQFNISRFYRCRSSVEMANTLEVRILQDKWIALSKKGILWLPPDYRPTCSAVRDGVVIVGHLSGRVSFLGFHL